MILFKCDRLNATLRPETCGRKYEQIQTGAIGSIRTYGTASEIGQCRGCPIGRSHLKGETVQGVIYSSRDVQVVEKIKLSEPSRLKPLRYLFTERVCKHEGCSVRFMAKGKRFYCDEHKATRGR